MYQSFRSISYTFPACLKLSKTNPLHFIIIKEFVEITTI